MSAPPRELDGARVLRYAAITDRVTPTGATRHYRGGTLLGRAAALAIASYSDGDGYYLFYLDEAGDVATDTWHASLDDALAQARYEYEGLAWTATDGDANIGDSS